MSNTLFKKMLAVVSATAIVLSVVAPVNYVSAASTSDAEKLAEAGIILSQDSAAGYRLEDEITRREFMKVVMNLSGLAVSDTCEGKFADLPSSDWGCKYAEAALDAGFIAANSTFRPDDNVSKWEALKMILKSKGLEKADGFGEDFVGAYVQAALDNGIITQSFTDYNAGATRSFNFSAAAAVMETEVEDEISICELLGTCDDTTTPTDTETETETETDTETTDPVMTGDEVLMVELSATSPRSTVIPTGTSGVVVARFDFTAGSSDVVVDALTLKRTGLSDSDTLTAVAVAMGDKRLSKSKNENSTDDTVELNLISDLVVKAGETITLDVLASINTTGVTSDRFEIQLLSVSADVNVEGEGVKSETMEISGIAAAGLTIENDGTSIASVKVGQENVEIAKFKVSNSSNDEDMNIKSITFKETGTIDDEDEMKDFKLYIEGEEVASTMYSKDKYLTFDLASGYMVKASKSNVKFVVKAEITGGAGKTVQYTVDNSLDVTAVGSKLGGVSLTSSGATGIAVSVEAGELVLTFTDADNTKIRENKKDTILGTVKVKSFAGKELELQRFNVTVTQGTTIGANLQDARSAVTTYLENVELYDVNSGRSYDLTETATNNASVFVDADLNVKITGEQVFQIRADTKNVSGTVLTDFGTARFTVSMTGIGGTTKATNDFYIIETQDDTAVTDVTPSSATFRVVDGSVSSSTLAIIPLSTAKNAVIGSVDVEALVFEISADDSSALVVDEVVVT
jgi:hypothetical protein